jgi:NADH:ubiquinone oxidoreductase subunit 3 (subunit A)
MQEMLSTIRFCLVAILFIVFDLKAVFLALCVSLKFLNLDACGGKFYSRNHM